MKNEPEIQILTESQISQSDKFINFKLIIIGDSGVGKSSLLKRAVKNTFDENYKETIGFEFLLMHFKVNDLKIKLQIWDTCGQELYRSLVQGFYNNSSLAIIVYNINNKQTFENLNIWLEDLKKHLTEDTPVFIIGNKNDLERKVSEEEAIKFKNENNIIYFAECSAKSGYNVKEIFFEVVKYLYRMYKEFKIKEKAPKTKKLKLDKNESVDGDNDKEKKKCCK